MVFLGEHTLLGRRAAIKTLLPTVAANRELVERFFNEARATSAISDPGVIQVFDFGYHVDGTAYIVMELLEGEALSARLDRLTRLSVTDSLRLARQIAGSLAVTHAHDIIHRDLKPENIFLVADAEAQGGERTKILDFGICKMGGVGRDVALTQSGMMVGTPVYMSPEQCRGAGGVDQRSDIYAFGCLVFHMLTGRPPFVRDAPGELIVAHLHEAPPAPSAFVRGLPPGVERAIDALLARCLAKAPEDRFATMTELHGALGELYAQLDVAESNVAPVAPAMALGRGFRSVYDGNVSRTGKLGASAATAARMPWLRYGPTTSSLAGQVEPDAADEELRPPRSRWMAAVAALVVAGLIAGVGVTSYVMYSDRAASAGIAPDAVAATQPGADPRQDDGEARGQAPMTPDRAIAATEPAANHAATATANDAATATANDAATATANEAAKPAANEAANEAGKGPAVELANHTAAAAPATDPVAAVAAKPPDGPAATVVPPPASAAAGDGDVDTAAEAAGPARRPSSSSASDRARTPKKRSGAARPRPSPVISPAQVSAAAAPVAPPAPAPVATPAAAPDAPSAPRPASPTEDLYETR